MHATDGFRAKVPQRKQAGPSKGTQSATNQSYGGVPAEAAVGFRDCRPQHRPAPFRRAPEGHVSRAGEKREDVQTHAHAQTNRSLSAGHVLLQQHRHAIQERKRKHWKTWREIIRGRKGKRRRREENAPLFLKVFYPRE